MEAVFGMDEVVPPTAGGRDLKRWSAAHRLAIGGLVAKHASVNTEDTFSWLSFRRGYDVLRLSQQ